MTGSRTLKVMHVLPYLDVGGMERNVINQVREGRKLGQEVSILCVEWPGELAERARTLGAIVRCVDKRPGLDWRVIRRIRRVIRELRPDVIHSHHIGALFYTGIAATGMLARLVHTEHGREPYATRRRTAWVGRIAGGFADVFYCLTEDMAAGVRAARVAPDRKIRVIANGIDTSIYRSAEGADGADAIRDQLGIPRAVPLVGTVGRVTEIKRQDVLIDAFASIRRRHSEAHLLLVGDGPLLLARREQAARLGLGSCVHFAGYQSETTPFLHAMDLFVLPSRSEGMPQALLEACAAAKPVIASNVGGIPEVITHETTGLLVPSGDAEALAAAICRVLADRPWGAAMARRASDAVTARFDVSRMAAEYHRDFVQLLDEAIPCPRAVPALSS